MQNSSRTIVNNGPECRGQATASSRTSKKANGKNRTNRHDRPEHRARKTRILLVDDHQIVRHAIGCMLEAEQGLQVVAEVDEGHDAVAAIKEHQPDLVILDLLLRHGDGVSLLKELRCLFEDLRVLVLSMQDEEIYAERVLRAGGNGYIMKGSNCQQLVDAIQLIMKGELYLSERMSNTLLRGIFNGGARCSTPSSPIDRLTDRELEVFRMLGQGMGTREIANSLCLSVKTIETYREHLKVKLNIKDAHTLVHRATHWVLNPDMFNEENDLEPLTLESVAATS